MILFMFFQIIFYNFCIRLVFSCFKTQKKKKKKKII
jgi:hypothetical protein